MDQFPPVLLVVRASQYPKKPCYSRLRSVGVIFRVLDEVASFCVLDSGTKRSGMWEGGYVRKTCCTTNFAQIPTIQMAELRFV